MAFETTLTVPTRDLSELSRRLNQAGFTLLDTGDRVATEEGHDAEATIRLVHLAYVEVDENAPCPMGVPA